MKTTIILSLLLSVNAFAKDMSRTETYEQSYKELPDGSTQYIGGCSLHQDNEGKKITVGKTIIEYFEPEYGSSREEVEALLTAVEPELLATAADHANIESFADADDITLEKIKSTVFKKLDLYRFNIGVGGGNGMYLVFNRFVKNNKVSYELLSNVFDGDVEFCDSKVWTK
jgi:hypothetical protein